MSDFATLRIQVDASGAIRVVDQFGKTVDGATKRVQAMEAAAKRVGAVVGTTLVAGLALVVKETADAQREQAQLAAALRSTAGASGQTIDSLNDHAAALRTLTAATGGEIAEAQALLLTFTKIGGDVFPRATLAVLDMAQALGTDARGAAMQLGKALNDPILGVTALGRAGVQFTDQQKATIKAFVDTNRLAEAQKIVLAELETQIGGSAAAYRNTLGGALTAVRESFLELFDASGAGMQELVTDINLVADALSTIPTRLAIITESVKNVAFSFDSFFAPLLDLLPGVDGTELEARFANSTNSLAALRRLLAEQQAGAVDGFVARARAGAGGAIVGTGAAGSIGSSTPFDIDEAEFAQIVGDLLRAVDAEKELAAIRLNAQTRQSILTGEFAEQVEGAREPILSFEQAVANLDEGVDGLTESARVFTEQLQLALGRFASDFLKDGFRSLDRFWEQFLQLGRDAIGQVFAKSVMDTLGDDIGDRLGGALKNALGFLKGNPALAIGGAAIGGLFAGAASFLNATSKWERAAQANAEAARLLQESAERQIDWTDRFLDFSGTETPMERTLRDITRARNTLAEQAFTNFNATNGRGTTLDFGALLGAAGGDFQGLLGTLRNYADNFGGVYVTLFEQLQQLAEAFERNAEAAAEATREQERQAAANRAATLERFRASLGLGGLSTLSANDMFTEARSQFDALAALAMGGDASAIDSLPEAARTLLEFGRQQFASSTRYAQLFADVDDTLERIALLERSRSVAGLPTGPLPDGVSESGVGFDFATGGAAQAMEDMGDVFRTSLTTLSDTLIAQHAADRAEVRANTATLAAGVQTLQAELQAVAAQVAQMRVSVTRSIEEYAV